LAFVLNQSINFDIRLQLSLKLKPIPVKNYNKRNKLRFLETIEAYLTICFVTKKRSKPIMVF